MMMSKQGESLSLALMSTDYERAASMQGEGPQRKGHAPPLHSPKAPAIAGD